MLVLLVAGLVASAPKPDYVSEAVIRYPAQEELQAVLSSPDFALQVVEGLSLTVHPEFNPALRGQPYAWLYGDKSKGDLLAGAVAEVIRRTQMEEIAPDEWKLSFATQVPILSTAILNRIVRHFISLTGKEVQPAVLVEKSSMPSLPVQDWRFMFHIFVFAVPVGLVFGIFVALWVEKIYQRNLNRRGLPA